MSHKKSLSDYEQEARWSGECLLHKSVRSRRIYIMRHGPVPVELEVCHTCDNGQCINDDHHFLGTHAENMRDMKNKGRQRLSQECRLRIADKLRKAWKTAEYRTKMLAAYATPESKERRGVVHRGKPKSAEHRARIGLGRTGVRATAAVRAKLSAAQKKAWAEGRYAGRRRRTK